MLKDIFYRNARARNLLDAFLVSAITSVLLVRFYLHLTGYPQLGGDTLHIAHMLWGGILMMVAIVIMLSFLGAKTRQLAAVVGGVGFGVFIDELGKFITKENDYFFQPTIGLIYAIFVILYLTFNFLTRAHRLTSREYQINALAELEEAVALDMDKAEKVRIYAMLKSSDQRSPITKHLRKLVDTLEISAAEKTSRWSRWGRKVDELYEKFWEKRGSNTFVSILFGAQVIVLAAGIIYTIYTNLEGVRSLLAGSAGYSEEVLAGQILSSLVASGFVIYGLYLLHSSRIAAFEQFRRAALVSLYLTQFFVFIRLEFAALPGFILNLLVLILISFVLSQEERLGKRNA
jgi:hypothetical protein